MGRNPAISSLFTNDELPARLIRCGIYLTRCPGDVTRPPHVRLPQVSGGRTILRTRERKNNLPVNHSWLTLATTRIVILHPESGAHILSLCCSPASYCKFLPMQRSQYGSTPELTVRPQMVHAMSSDYGAAQVSAKRAARCDSQGLVEQRIFRALRK